LKPEVWLVAGGAVTHGLPVAFGGTGFGELGVRIDRWELGAGAYWAPGRSIPFAPGEVEVKTWGGRARACFALTTLAARVRPSGCAFGVVSSLSGAATGFTTSTPVDRVWGMAGGGADLAIAVASRVAIGLQAIALVSLHREEFTVEPLGRAYTTDPVAGWVGGDLRVRIW
jgi:hypothetical protein